MNKRAALLSLLFLSLALPAQAGPHPQRFDVNWRNQLAGFSPSGIIDSTDAGAVGTAAQHVDTSSAIAIGELIIPGELASGPVTTASDSLAWLRISFKPLATTPTVAADSIYLQLQVTDDGITWIDTTPTSVFAAAGLSDASFTGAVLLETDSNNQFVAVLRQRVGATAGGAVFFPVASVATNPTWQQIYGFQYLRLIVQSDVTGRYDATVQGFVAD